MSHRTQRGTHIFILWENCAHDFQSKYTYTNTEWTSQYYYPERRWAGLVSVVTYNIKVKLWKPKYISVNVIKVWLAELLTEYSQRNDQRNHLYPKDGPAQVDMQHIKIRFTSIVGSYLIHKVILN